MAVLPDARLGNERLGSGEHGPRERSQALIKRDVHAIEQSGDLGVRTSIKRRRFPQACAVEV